MVLSFRMNQQVAKERNIERFAAGLKVGLAVLAAAGLVGTGVYFYRDQAEKKEIEAFARLYEAEKMEKTALSDAETSKKEILEVMASWPSEKKSAYEAKLEAVLKDSKATTAACIAGLRLGRFRIANGANESAKAAFESVLSSASKDQLVLYRAMALDSLASLEENASQFEAALKRHEESLGISDNPIRPVALLGKARTLRALGRESEALATYDQVATDFSNSSYARQARALKALGAR
jgi:tetratricopeptide (TPR) repeat protein